MISCVIRSPHVEEREPHGVITLRIFLFGGDLSEKEQRFFFFLSEEDVIVAKQTSHFKRMKGRHFVKSLLEYIYW